MNQSNQKPASKVRLDKWLWAARFFKTRSLAKQAIEGGKVQYDGARAKVSKEVLVGATLKIRHGWDEKSVLVLALSEQRRGSPEAAKLYKETQASREAREEAGQKHRAMRGMEPQLVGRPSKKQRRQIQHFKEHNQDCSD